MERIGTLNQSEKKELYYFLFFSFFIAWGSEILLIGFNYFGLVQGIVGKILHFSIIGFGAGMAPTYAAFFVKKKYEGMKGREFLKLMFQVGNGKKFAFYGVILATVQFLACFAQEDYLGNPIYFFLVIMPLMIIGGGLEEVGWRGVLQPLLEKRFHFVVAGIIEGILWSVWHLPLWFVPNSSQANYHFVAFTLYCLTLGFTLAIAYNRTKSVFLTILLHAWGNTTLGGMYTLTSLENLRPISLVVYVVQLLILVGVYYLGEKRNAFRGKRLQE